MTTAAVRRSAFTLLEVVVAMLLVAIILVAVHTAMSSGLRSYRRSRDASERDNMAWSAAWLVGQDLQRLPVQTDAGAPSLVGMRDRSTASYPMLRLRADTRLAPDAKPMLVDYFFTLETSRGGTLVRRSEPLRRRGAGAAEEGPADLVRYEEIATGLRRVGFRYFDGQAWTERWDSAGRSGLPKLVELTLEFADARGNVSEYRRALPVVVEGPLLAAPGGEAAP